MEVVECFIDELAFKKIAKFSYGSEIRFAHLLLSDLPLKLTLKDQMAGIEDLGLQLLSVSTNDIDGDCDVESF